MPRQLFVIGLSFAYVFAVLGLGLLGQARLKLSGFVTRKIIHIGVAHWWFFYLWGLQSLFWGLLGPVFFILFNILAARTRLLQPMAPQEGENNLGTIYYPISLAILVVLCAGLGMPSWIGLASVLVLGWGDGLAALIGKAFGKSKIPFFGGKKSYLGTLTLVLVSIIVLGILLLLNTSHTLPTLLLMVVFLGVLVGFLELSTPWGLDNLVIPLGLSLLLWYLV